MKTILPFLNKIFEFWIKITKRYGDNSNVAMLELFNEPTLAGGKYGICSWEQWK